MSIPACRFCSHRAWMGSAKTNARNYGKERQGYVCKHPEAERRCKAVSDRYPGFIGFSKPVNIIQRSKHHLGGVQGEEGRRGSGVMEKTCGNCGQVELEIRKVRCPHRRGLQDMVDFMGHARYDHHADEPACEHWIEAPNTLEQCYKHLAEVARDLWHFIADRAPNMPQSVFILGKTAEQLEELGVDLCSRS